jgi:hypothetical protein
MFTKSAEKMLYVRRCTDEGADVPFRMALLQFHNMGCPLEPETRGCGYRAVMVNGPEHLQS